MFEAALATAIPVQQCCVGEKNQPRESVYSGGDCQTYNPEQERHLAVEAAETDSAFKQ